MKIDFTKIVVETSFEGDRTIFNVAHEIGNRMKYNGSVLLDIGFEDLAKEIYYSKGEVEVPDNYKAAMIQIVKESNFIACVKRTLIDMLK